MVDNVSINQFKQELEELNTSLAIKLRAFEYKYGIPIESVGVTTSSITRLGCSYSIQTLKSVGVTVDFKGRSQ